jgi:hypothetical protein
MPSPMSVSRNGVEAPGLAAARGPWPLMKLRASTNGAQAPGLPAAREPWPLTRLRASLT